MWKYAIVMLTFGLPEWGRLCLYALFMYAKKIVLNEFFLTNDSDGVIVNECSKIHIF